MIWDMIIAGPKSKMACQGQQQQFCIHSPACGRRREKVTLSRAARKNNIDEYCLGLETDIVSTQSRLHRKHLHTFVHTRENRSFCWSHKFQIWGQIWPPRLFGGHSSLKTSFYLFVSNWWNFFFFYQQWMNFSKIPQNILQKSSIISMKILINLPKIKFSIHIHSQPQLLRIRSEPCLIGSESDSNRIDRWDTFVNTQQYNGVLIHYAVCASR